MIILASFWADRIAGPVKKFMEKYGVSPFLGVLFVILLALVVLYLGLLGYQRRFNKKAQREWEAAHGEREDSTQ
ncbi:MAG: hypothetical protein FWD16_00710 [Clostridia bacterium]|nr:hypothetical protein [Clostridia bacterium]